MALTLKDAITATQTTIDVNGTDTLTNGDMYSLDDEYVLINTADPRSIQPGETAYQRVSLDRGVLGTRKAAHAAAATLTAVNIASGGGGGGVTVLEDPGNVYPATPTAVALGYRVSETITGEVRVFEVSSAGTTEASAMADLELDLSPLGIIAESDVEWTYLGIVGQLPWDVAPQVEGLRVDVGAGGPLALHYTSTAGPGDSERLVVFFATVADVALEVFQAKTDGDADWFLDENTGAGFRFSNAVDGVIVPLTPVTQITTTGFGVSADATHGFDVTYAPFAIIMSGLPTADPLQAGALYTDGVPSAGVPQALMVSGGPP